MKKLLCVALLTVLLGACSNKDDSASPRRRGRDVTSTATAGSTTTTAVPGERRPGTSPQPPSPLQPPPVQGGPLAPDAVRPTDPGTYLYNMSGKTKISGCFTEERPPPTPMTVVVDPPNGNRQQVVRDERDSQGRGDKSTLVLEYRSDGVYLAFMRLEQSAAVTSVIEFLPEPPVLVLPLPAEESRAWGYRLKSTDGKVIVESSNLVRSTSDRAVTAGGQAVDTFVVEATNHITGQSSQGALDLTVTATDWISPERRMAIKGVTDTKGTAGLCEIESHIESQLR